jgi:hypothetical protein
MPCPKCVIKPGYHDFHHIGKGRYYTSPAKTEDLNEDGTKLQNIKIHIDEIQGPWIWILDCGDMGLQHYTELGFNLGLLQILAEAPGLQEIWIVRPNIWIQGVIGCLSLVSSAPILNKVTYYESPLGLPS